MKRTRMDDANKMKLNTKHMLNFDFMLFFYWPRFKIHLLLTNSLEVNLEFHKSKRLFDGNSTVEKCKYNNRTRRR